jgi:hypothetical protein
MAKGTREQIAEQNRRYRNKYPEKYREYHAKYRREAGVVPVLITSPAEKLLRKWEKRVVRPWEDLSGLTVEEKRKRAKRRSFEARPGLRRFYKTCRKEDIRRATPGWADRGRMLAIYAEAKAGGLEVDHIVPLRSDVVCGLHCEANLRSIPGVENAVKGNRFWPDMP